MKNRSIFLILTAISLLLLVWAYLNHFDNDFAFDDAHTIQSNLAIRDLGNIPSFFTDASTTSSLPANQAYRPGLTTLNAIDYAIAGGTDPFYFHLSIFISYLLLLVLLFFFIRHIFRQGLVHRHNNLFALAATTWFGVSTANAETINYIIARSDSFSTLMVVASFAIYTLWPPGRKYYLHLLTFLAGAFVKEPVVMFAPLLFVYVYLFEGKCDFLSLGRAHSMACLKLSWKRSWIFFVLAFALFGFFKVMTPETWTPGGPDTWVYLRTQPFVIFHYFINFYFPFNLSADTDWTPFFNPWDERMFAGIAFIVIMLVAAFRLSTQPEHRPTVFGILWFFIALIPTSSIFPLAEVLNDHRPFFAHIGLVIATVNALVICVYKYERSMQKFSGTLLAIFLGLIIVLNAYGTRQRSEVWDNAESLWFDVTINSPKNGRGLMNYGLTQMNKGNYQRAEHYFNEALKLIPEYSYLHVNLGVLRSHSGQHELAEQHFQKAVSVDPYNPETYYFYAQWLFGRERYEEAAMQVEQLLKVSPAHAHGKLLKSAIEGQLGSGKSLEEAVLSNPTPEGFIELFMRRYQQGDYEGAIVFAKKALELNPDYALAHNNICSAYNALGKYQEAARACEEALRIQPDYELARNNLAISLQALNQPAQ